MANYSRKQSNHGYADWYLGSDEVKNEKAYIEETNADEYAYPLNAEFHTYIPTPRLFRDYKSSSIEMEAALDDLINQISSINRTRNSEKADGSALSFMGSLLAIAGTVAAPFTLGGSLLLVGTGIAMSIGGSEVSSEAETRMASEISNTLQEAQAYLNDYKNQELKWTYAAQLLNEIVDDLKNVFNELEFSFSNLVRCIEHVSYSDMSSNGVLNAAKGSCLRAAIGKPKVAYTTTKQVLASGRQVIRSVQKTTQVSQSAKMVSSAVDGTARVVKTERTVHELVQQ